MFEIETARLLIRPWRDDDRPAFLAIMQNREVVEFLHGGVPYTEQDVEGVFVRQARQLAEHGFCMGAMVEKATGALVGSSGTQPLGTTGDLEIGWIVDRAAWGRGYATEAGRAAMDYVLQTLGRERVVAIIDPGNLPSKKVAARLGMEYEARYTGTQLGHRLPELVVDLFFRRRA